MGSYFIKKLISDWTKLIDAKRNMFVMWKGFYPLKLITISLLNPLEFIPVGHGIYSARKDLDFIGFVPRYKTLYFKVEWHRVNCHQENLEPASHRLQLAASVQHIVSLWLDVRYQFVIRCTWTLDCCSFLFELEHWVKFYNVVHHSDANRYSDIQIFRYSDIQIFRYSDSIKKAF